jgi:hypothetical protein
MVGAVSLDISLIFLITPSIIRVKQAELTRY